MDPFTLAYRAIWSALLAHSGFTALVKPGNQVDVSADAFQRLKDDVQSADTPQVLVLQSAFSIDPFGDNSLAVSFTQGYEILATFDTLQLVSLNALKWETLRALVKAGPSLGQSFVRGWDISHALDDPFGRLPYGRKLKNWVSVLTVHVRMDMAKSQVTAP